jgi:hypothetical protein
MLPPATRPPFPLTWGFTTRLDDPGALPAVRLRQVHGCDVVEASEDLQAADGIWTMRRGLAVGVRVADCVPILLAGPALHGEPWVAALHAGWRGAVGGILSRGIGVYLAQGGLPENLAWALGPAILKCHFEVGPEVLEAARRDHAWTEDLAAPGPGGKPHLDLHGFLRAQALRAGLAPDRDGTLARCTRCESGLFHSFRGGDLTGRQWGWVRID